MSIKSKYALVCDSVRQEDNGKLIFVGVYTGDIVVSQFPASIVLQVWISLETEKDSPSEKFSVRVSLDQKKLGELDAFIEAIDESKPVGPANVSLPPVALQIEQQADFIVEMRGGGGDWTDLLRKTIRLQTEADAAPAAERTDAVLSTQKSV